MLRRFLAPLALFVLLIPAAALAYGAFGHETIARIAMLNVKPQTARAVRALLSHDALLDTPTCKAATPEQASTWPDCVRALGDRFSYTSSWHYQDIDICLPFALKEACRDGNCVSAQIERDIRLLQDRATPLRERVMALAFLIHFVGDLHMPLHSGERGDKGGNDVKAAYGDYSTRWLNLHSIWDGALAERAITTPPEILRVYTPQERARIAAGSVEDWTRETWQVSHDTTYAAALNGDPCGPKAKGQVKLSNATIEQLVPVARLQVERAGLRLARVLDEAFDPAKAFDSRLKPRRAY